MKKLLVLFIISCVSFQFAFAVISKDASSTGSSTGGGPASWSHTNSGSLLVVHVVTQDKRDTITDVTYNGVSMTLAKAQSSGINTAGRVSTYYLANPATGANTVTVTYSNFSGNGVIGLAESYNGAGGIGATNGQTTTADPQTLAVTTTINNSWLVGAVGDANINASYGAGTNTTVRQYQNGSSKQIASYDSNTAQTPVGSYSQETTGNSGETNQQTVVEITPSVAATSVFNPALFWDF